MSNGSADNPGGVGGAASLPFGMTAIDPVFKHPTVVHVVGGRAARGAARLRRRRDLRRPPGPLPAAREQHQPAAARHDPGESRASTPTALRPYKGYGVIRLSENAGYSKYNGLQISADRRYRNGFKFGAAYTLSHSEDNASNKRDVLFNCFDDSGYWGNSSFDRRHVFNFYYIYDLPFFASRTRSCSARRWADGRSPGSTFMRTGTPLWVTETTTSRGVGDAFAQPYNQVGDPNGEREPAVLGGQPPTRTSGSTRTAFARRRTARSATRRATACTARASTSGTSRSSRTSR